MKPKVIVAPEFRRMEEVFDPPTLDRLHDLVDVQWGSDGPMPQGAFMSAQRSCVQRSSTESH